MVSDKIDYKKLFLDSIKKFPNAEKWVGAEFSGIKTASNTSVGNIGEDFVLNYSIVVENILFCSISFEVVLIGWY